MRDLRMENMVNATLGYMVSMTVSAAPGRYSSARWSSRRTPKSCVTLSMCAENPWDPFSANRTA